MPGREPDLLDDLIEAPWSVLTSVLVAISLLCAAAFGGILYLLWKGIVIAHKKSKGA
jgi:hypothetical protein